MTQDLDTEIDGSPEAIEAVAQWLRVTLRDAASSHADALVTQRARTEDAWEGEAASAFRTRLTQTIDAGDGLSSHAAEAGRSLDLVAAAVREAQREMARARSTAAAGGLNVDGMIVRHPGSGPSRPTTPSADAPQPVIDAHNRAVDAYDQHQLLLLSWNDAVEIAAAAWQRLDEALLAAAERWQANAGNLASLTQGFIAGGVEGFSAAASRSRFRGIARVHDFNAGRLARHLDDLNPGGIPRTDAKHLYDLIDARNELHDKAKKALADSRRVKPSRTAANSMRALGTVTSVYGVYDDYVNGGESMAQAVVSNTGGLLAGMGAGALVGQAIVPIPIVGAVAGAIVGAGVGIVTSGMIDSMWENGVDGVGDVFSAVGDGFGDVADTVKDVGGMVKDGWNKFFG